MFTSNFYQLSVHSSPSRPSAPVQPHSDARAHLAHRFVPGYHRFRLAILAAFAISAFGVCLETKVEAAISSGEIYTLSSQMSGKNLDDGHSTADGASVIQWTPNTNPTQQWKIIDVGSGYYKLINQYSGKALDNGNVTTEGAAVMQWTDQGNNPPTQKWLIVDVGSGYCKLLNQMSGKALDNGNVTTEGSSVIQWTDNGKNTQRWLIQKSSTTTPPATSIRDSILPAVKNGGFSMPGYDLWCPSIIQVGDTYHLFASRWPYSNGLDNWNRYSECIRATSKNLYGPYTFQGVVLQKRPGFWDNGIVHNPRIVKRGTTYIIYYIDSAMECGYAYSQSITGPWTRSATQAMSLKNPAPLVRADNSLYIYGINKSGSGLTATLLPRAYTAPIHTGPYSLVSGMSIQNACEVEDPCIWWANNQYNMIGTDWNMDSLATGTFKNGVQYYSKDGKYYQLMSNKAVFTLTVKYDDGSTETLSRRERPYVVTDSQGRAIALLTGCLPQSGPSKIVINPINNYYPNN